MSDKQQFIDIYRQNITRQGNVELLNFLENKSDFFTAPASTRFHLACEGGLVKHSLNVFQLLSQNCGDEQAESIAICGLLHDICKVNYYKVSLRNVKNEKTGQWEKQPYYQVDDSFPYGHGEKSVYMIESFMKLKAPEAMAIRWHMGGFDDTVKAGNYSISHAYERYPLAVKLHVADLTATYLVEAHTSDAL